MGNSVLDGRSPAVSSGGVITKFYSSGAWIDGRAEEQLNHVASWAEVQKIAAFPDLHPGKYGPVGCAILADRVFPQLIGSDIGCGMSLFELSLPTRKLKLEKALRRMRVLGEPVCDDHSTRLEAADLPTNLQPGGLGTIGGGNHFCEVQAVAQCAEGIDLDPSRLYLLVHAGSRGVGSAVFDALPQGAFDGLAPGSDAAETYLKAHDHAARWARLNRQVIAERAADALRSDLRLCVDAPHNLLTHHEGGWLHRKGAAAIGAGLVPLAGSRAAPSFLMSAMDHPDALGSLAHGSGRRYDRASMHGRLRAKKSDIDAMQRTRFGGRVLCEDRDLLIEEASLAYKSPDAVAADLEGMGAARRVAVFHPLLTFKKTRERGRA